MKPKRRTRVPITDADWAVYVAAQMSGVRAVVSNESRYGIKYKDYFPTTKGDTRRITFFMGEMNVTNNVQRLLLRNYLYLFGGNEYEVTVLAVDEDIARRTKLV